MLYLKECLGPKHEKNCGYLIAQLLLHCEKGTFQLQTFKHLTQIIGSGR